MIGNINLNTFVAVEELFKRKGWDAKSKLSSGLSKLDRFCERLKLFSIEEQALLIELSEKFLHITTSDYLEKFLASYYSIPQLFFEKYNTIYVAPLIDPYIHTELESKRIERGKTKSSTFLFYSLDWHDITWIDFYSKLVFVEQIGKLKKSLNPENSSLILIDDYIGTGRTAEEVCKIYLKEDYQGKTLRPDQIKILTIASQNAGKEYVENKMKVMVTCDIFRNKGISDNFKDKDALVMLDKMKDMERRLCSKKFLKSGYSLGYGQSEGLISIANKTPNNTFPVFWYETKKMPAPFPRYNNFGK